MNVPAILALLRRSTPAALTLLAPCLLLACGESQSDKAPDADDEVDCQSCGPVVLSGGGGGEGMTPDGSGSAAGGGSGGGAMGPPITNPAVRDCVPVKSKSVYAFDENVPPSALPPGGLLVEETPLFVSIGFDDNLDRSGMQWATAMLQTRGVRSTFYHTSEYVTQASDDWVAAHAAGMETGHHTDDHAHGGAHPEAEWLNQLDTTERKLGAIGIDELYGFRSPFLEYNDALLSALEERGVWYDCSIEEGFDASMDGTNFLFPYTLDSGAPGHEVNRQLGVPTRQFSLTRHPGLFELPVYALVIPADEHAANYGFAPGLRDRLVGKVADFENHGFKITGFDWNLWFAAELSGPEVVAVLKYNFDQRLAGNRAPLLFGAHSNYYSSDAPERRQAIEDFLDYVLTVPEARIVNHKEILDFMREPMPLSCY